MSPVRKVDHDPERGAPIVFQHFRLPAKKIPERRTIKARIIDFIQLELCMMMTYLPLTSIS